MSRHIDREYEGELVGLRERVLLMGARVEEMIGLAMRAFLTRDPELAASTITLDRQIDAAEKEIDELAIRVLARRQPVASDLRLITTTLKLVTDLERIGDLAVNICERVKELASYPPPSVTQSLVRMDNAVRAMLADSLDAFGRRDPVLAAQVVERDRPVDAYYAQLFLELVSHMMADAANVAWATRMQSIGKCLERIADHATNIAEMVVFMVDGEDVRHAPHLVGTA
ncbi:MAG: phosphate signaling complex protein PhoU [Polyangiaceae bacterium]|nr:phosphate signaling complex protein PhoU [Polyangiaceae bacterium]